MDIFLSFLGFLLIAVAADKVSHFFPRFKLPIITGLLFIGILAGSSLLGFIKLDDIPDLFFVNETCLAFIAFAAGAELHFEELKGRMKSIKWMTFGQLFCTFVISAIFVYYLADNISFMHKLSNSVRFALAILISTIFVARSPASAIAVINEMRAKGPFTKTAIGVTVLKDVLVIILFTVCFAYADAVVSDISFDFIQIFILLGELVLSFFLGLFLGALMSFIISFDINIYLKSISLIFVGYMVYFLSHKLYDFSEHYWGFHLYVEPLLICIIASFYVVNYTKNRREFMRIIELTVPFVYIAFFTLTGASISLEILAKTWTITLLFFVIRLLGMIVGSFVGGYFSGETWSVNKIGWMPYVTQAGVALGLVAVVSTKFASFGAEFSTVMISVIVLNQIVGPPLFKWSILRVGESHTKSPSKTENTSHDVVLFGLEGQSLTLFRELEKHHYNVRLFECDKNKANQTYQGVEVEFLAGFTLKHMTDMGLVNADIVVLLNTDEENLKACEIIYEHFSVKNILVRVHERSYVDEFKQYDALIIDPSTIMVNLLEHMVRSPLATSILLGDDEKQSTEDIVMNNPNLDGVAIRDLTIPSDIVIMATKRNNNIIVSTGYTRLRLADVLTLFGSVESIDKLKLLMDENEENSF